MIAAFIALKAVIAKRHAAVFLVIALLSTGVLIPMI